MPDSRNAAAIATRHASRTTRPNLCPIRTALYPIRSGRRALQFSGATYSCASGVRAAFRA